MPPREKPFDLLCTSSGVSMRDAHLREVRLNYVKGLLGDLSCMSVNRGGQPHEERGKSIPTTEE
jgi:hypothetical protein